MKYVEQPRTANREIVNALLRRAKRFHSSVSGSGEADVTDLRHRLRSERRAGRDVSLAAYLVKATAQVMHEQPHLNRHLFTGLFGRRRIVEFDQVHCTLVVARRDDDKNEILLPALLKDVDKRSVDEIEREIRTLKSTPLQELPLMRDMERVNRLPWIALELMSFKARSDPDFYMRYFGTYGLSSLVRVGGHVTSNATLANTAIAFLPNSIRKLPRFAGDQVVAREVLSFTAVFDHFILDGIQMLRAGERLAELLEDPSALLGAPRDAPRVEP